MKKILTILLIVGIPAIIFSQNSLYGKITDQEGNPLQGVEIYAPKIHKGTLTNSNGYYEIKNLPNSTVTFIFSSIGFQSVSKEIEIKNDPIEINVVLQEAIFQMDEVVVSTPFNKLQSENVMKVEFKTTEQLQRSGAISLSQGISNISGVSTISTGLGIGKPVIRGLSGNRVLVYSQGVRIENQQFGDEHGLGLNDNGLQSVEVIKGPASLLYGSDALGGVLYFNPEKFVNANTISSSVSQKYFSNTEGTSTQFDFKASTEKVKFLTSALYNSHSDYKIPDGDRVTNTRFNDFDVKAGLGFNLKDFSSELRFNFNTSKIGITEGIGDQSTSISMKLPYQRIENYILSSHNHLFFDRSKLDMDFGYIANNRKEFEEHHHEEEHDEEEAEEEEHHELEITEPALYMKLKTFTYNVKYHLPKFNNLETIIGVQGLTQSNTNYGEEILIPDANVNDLGVFTTALFQWKNNTLQGGIRFDTRSIKTEEHLIEHEEDHEEEEHEEEHEEDHLHEFEAIDKYFQSFTASLGYKTTLFETIISRFNFATGYRAPNLAELTSNGIHHGTNRYELGNTELSNEQNYQFDISFEYTNDHLELFINGFYNYINNYIYITPNGEVIDDADVFTYVQDNAKLYGGEVGFHYHPHPLDWLHLESSFETVIGKQNNGDYLPLIPANQLNNTIKAYFKNTDWLKNGYASLKLENYFKQSNISTFETATDGYNLLHFSAGGDMSIGNIKFSANFSVSNIFDTTYISHLSRFKSDGIFNMGRNIVVGIKFNI